MQEIINYLAREANIEPSEIIAQSVVPSGEDSWEVSISDSRETASAEVYRDETGELSNVSISFQ